MNRLREERGEGAIAGLFGIVGIIIVVFLFIGAAAWLFSFHGVGPGEVAIVKEGGPFDGRDVKEIRQPGSGAKPIGAFNHQYVLPTSQRDLTEEAGTIRVPTADGVNVLIDGQALFQLRTDPALVEKFYRNFGVRTWGGDDLWDDAGWDNFLKIRLVPILQRSIRSVIGTEDCTSLNNTCIYVLNADSILASNEADATKKAQDQAKQANTQQNLAEAERKISEAFKNNLKSGLGTEYFEGVQFQNLRVTFDSEIQQRVTAAQGARAEVATARLRAQRVKADAKGKADATIEAAIGDRKSKEQQARGVRALARAYRTNPQQAKIDQTKAFCGPNGCNPQAIGTGVFGSLSGVNR